MSQHSFLNLLEEKGFSAQMIDRIKGMHVRPSPSSTYIYTERAIVQVSKLGRALEIHMYTYGMGLTNYSICFLCVFGLCSISVMTVSSNHYAYIGHPSHVALPLSAYCSSVAHACTHFYDVTTHRTLSQTQRRRRPRGT